MHFSIKHFLLLLMGANALIMCFHYYSATTIPKQEHRLIGNFLETSVEAYSDEKPQGEDLLLAQQHLKEAQDLISKLVYENKEMERIMADVTKRSDADAARTLAEKQTFNYVTETLTKINPFRKLGLYETMPAKYYNYKADARFIPNTQYYQIKHNPGYCDAVDLYNYHNPDNIFKNMNFISDYGGDEFLIRREVMRKVGHDVMPAISVTKRDHQLKVHEMAVNGTMYFFKVIIMHSLYKMNEEWGCLSQLYNHIPGGGVITRKDLLAQTINTYTQKYTNKPQCITEETFFPRAYRLDLQSECSEFFNIINTEKYQENKKDEPLQYLIKLGTGAHRAMGVFLMHEEFEQEIRQSYNNGTLCGQVKKSYIAQRYISNPLLLDRQNKFDFRIYMLVASVNPLIVYYHDGFLRISLSKYDKHSKEKNVHLTNTHLSKDVFKKAQAGDLIDGMTEQELREYQMWTMEDLEAYLLETGKIEEQDWLDSYLRPKFKEAFVHIARMAEDSFYKSSSVFELYGLDFVIDENLNLWFIECNPSPQMVGTNERKTDFLVTMIQDLFEIQYAYLRSRMKRVFEFVRNMEERAQAGEELDYKQMRADFDLINMNKLEPEYQIREDNTFTLIIDKNIKGHEAYFDNLTPECIDV